MTQLIGRLPSGVESSAGSRSLGHPVGDDNELQLLELQLIATQSTHHYRLGTYTYPRNRHRKTRGSLMTLWARKGLLDEGPVATRQLLGSINTRWNFNAFSLDRLTSGHNLATLCTYLFRDLGLLQHFRLDALAVWRFFAAVESHYHATNPYHNGVHAADVTQAMSCFINEPVFSDHLKPVEKMAAIIAAVGHDLDHPGLNEKFLITTSSHLAGLYNNNSVLENHHWRTCVALMHETGLASALNATDLHECQQIIQSMVLATDISRQADFLCRLGHFLDNGMVDMSLAIYRHFMLQIALKCADISNPCRTWNISRLWSYRACEEFYRQGDRERELNLPVTPLCDRNGISVAKVQSTFYRNVAAPLFEEWHRAVNTPLSANMMSNLSSNQARWDLICQQEGRMAESIVSTSSSSGDCGGGSVSRRGSLDPGPASYAGSCRSRLSRSSGDDDSAEDQCGSYPYMPLDAPETTYPAPPAAAAAATPAAAATSDGPLSPSRRHSFCLSDSLFLEPVEVTLHRQLSLMEKQRRSSAVQELRKQNSDLLATLKTAKRRRVFCAMHNRKTNSCSAAESNLTSSAELTNAAKNKVTFHLSNSVDNGSVTCSTAVSNDPDYIQIGKTNANLMMHQRVQHNSQRRGSAPCTLLLNQINKITTSATKAASTASREHSPRARNCFSRRSSLDLDNDNSLIDLDSNPNQMSKKKQRKLLRRKSAGAGDGVSPSEVISKRNRNPSLGKRGSFRSSSFGGGVTHPSGVQYSGRLSWHGKQSQSNKMEVVNEAAKIFFRNNYSELRLLEEEAIHDRRRGSLPLILC